MRVPFLLRHNLQLIFRIKISHLINNARDLSNLEINDNGQTSVENLVQEFDIGVSSPYNNY